MSDGARCHYCRKVPCECPEPKPMSAPLPEERIKEIAERCELWKSNPSLWQEERQLAARKDIPDLLQEVQRLTEANLELESERTMIIEQCKAHERTISDASLVVKRDNEGLKAELALAHGRVSVLEDAVLKASVYICESSSIDDRAAMKVLGKVMDEAAMKRLGI